MGTFITPSIVAKESLIVLLNELQMAMLVHKDFSDEFKKVGDTITVRKPATFEAVLFDGDLENDIQPITEGSVQVKLDKILDVTFEVSSKELTLEVDEFTARLITPAVQALAQKVDELLCGRYVDIPYFVDMTEAAGTIKDIATVRKKLNVNKVPMTNRYAVLCPKSETDYLILDTFVEADKRGDNRALKEGAMGRVYGVDHYMSQNIKTHALGTLTTSDLITCVLTGDVLTLTAASATHTVTAGTLLTASDGQVFTITDNYNVTSGGVVVAHQPAIKASVTIEAITTIHAAHEANLYFHRNAFALVNRPLAPPIGGATAAVENYKGLSIRVVYGYTQLTKKNLISLDMLVGTKTLTPELACRLCDA